ncbi:MAG TPA: hypothetical protein VFC79_05680 [Tissierellaceae bacterium]|nr:hypothetical protein [Tissierellaceae bacterium]
MFGCSTEKDYKDKASAILKGIAKIKEEISKCKSEEKKRELASYFEADIRVLEKTYCECRKQYDKDFVDCRED